MRTTNVSKGMLAGFAASSVLAMLILVDMWLGLTSPLGIIYVLTKLMGASSAAGGWIGHFVIGTVFWGGLFALIEHRLPGHSRWMKGVAFGTGAWLLMMTILMPLAGLGLFGFQRGVIEPFSTLCLHLIYGTVLGLVYQLMHPNTTHGLGALIS